MRQRGREKRREGVSLRQRGREKRREGGRKGGRE